MIRTIYLELASTRRSLIAEQRSPSIYAFVMTLTEPKIYTKPWVSETKNFRLSRLKEFAEELFCIPSQEQEFNRRMRDPAAGIFHKD